MNEKMEFIIAQLQEINQCLERQMAANLEVNDSRNQQIAILKEEVEFLTTQNKKLSEGLKHWYMIMIQPTIIMAEIIRNVWPISSAI